MAQRRWFDPVLSAARGAIAGWRGAQAVSTIDLLDAGQPTGGDLTAPEPLRVDEEFGVTGTQAFGGILKHDDPNPDWDNFQRAVAKADIMRRSDSQIRAMLEVIKLPLLGATWEATPPEGGDAQDQRVADFINASLFDDDAMQDPWHFTLKHILMQLEYGFSVLELIWRVEEDGTYRLKRMAPRLQRTIRYWHLKRDGELAAVVQYAAINDTVAQVRVSPGASDQAPSMYSTRTAMRYITLPADYLAVFSFDKEGDNYEGNSILRSVWKNYFFKDQAYHLEGVRLDRWGAGIPVAKLGPGKVLTTSEMDALTEVLKKIRSNEKAYIIEPDGVTFRIMPEGSAKGTGSGAIPWIDHHDTAISQNVLAGFLAMGRQPHGTLGFGSRLTDLFISSLRGVADGIASDLKRQVVKKLCFPPQAQVSMADGTRRAIASIRVGDSVLSHDGRAHKVLDVMMRDYAGDLVSIKATGHAPVACTPEHPVLLGASRPLWTQRHKYARGVVEKAWAEAQQAGIGDYLLAPVAVSGDNGPSPALARVMGYFLAEGCFLKSSTTKLPIGVQFTMGSADHSRGFVADLVEAITTLGYQPTVKHVPERKTVIVHVRQCPELVHALQACGEFSHGKHFPSDVLSWSSYAKRALLSGYWNGDGCFYTRDDGYVFGFAVSRSHQLINVLVTVIESLGISCLSLRRPPRGRSKEAWEVRVSGTHCESLQRFLTNGTAAPEGRQLHQKSFCMDGYHHYRVQSVERAPYVGPVFNLEVEDTHTYVCEGLVVHNCDLNFDMRGRQYPSVGVKALDMSDIDALVQVMAKLSGTFLTPDDDTESMLRKLLQLPPLPQNVSRAAKMATNKTSDPAGVPIPVGGSAGGAAAAPGPGTVVHHDVPPEEGVVHHTAPPTSGAAPPAAATGGVMQHGPASGTEGQTVHHDLSDTDDEDEDE